MNKNDFIELEKHIFDDGNPWEHIWADRRKVPNKLSYFASWAIYDDSVNESNFEQFVKNNVDSLKNNIVFVGLNFSNPLRHDWKPWINIRENFNVRWLLDGQNFDVSKYKGAYITDVLKNVIGANAANVMNEIDRKKIEQNISFFIEEINLLKSENIEMYLFGKDVEIIFREYIMGNKDVYETIKKKVKKCQRIFHYSGRRTNDFRQFAPSQIGLIDPPEKNTPIHILWDANIESTKDEKNVKGNKNINKKPINKNNNPTTGSLNFENDIKPFFEGKGFTMSYSQGRNYIFSSRKNHIAFGIVFYIRENAYKFKWGTVNEKEVGLEFKLPKIRTKYENAEIDPETTAKNNKAIVFPLDQNDVLGHAYKIVKDTAGMVGYPPPR